eukprot:TRINITY_DN1639_c0_g1_i1.p2 TRINITY_DN1639_c0_g1~~TRINITY_DN1639_c0_g1_i1.p2  ORF type:complete len:148 (-),score=28.18 TRINITY_DN1639_c0_g1_i1:40-483(-)
MATTQQPQTVNANSTNNTSKLKPAKFVTVDQLKPGTYGHNILVKVVSSNTVVEKQRADGTKIRVAEAVIGDQTGVITLTARNAQIDVLIPGATLVIRNAKIDMYRGFMRLAVDKWGLIKTAPEPATFDVLTTNDLSSVEYELVTVDA